jgi:hypothetical protein
MRGTIESRPDISYQNDQSTAAEQRTEESGEQGLDATSIAAHQAETEEQSALDQSTSDEVASETTTEVTANTDAGRSLTFQRLVQNWESYVNNGTRNVQIGLQNLSLCGVGEGLARIGPAPPRRRDGDDDPFAPIVLRHTHSSPLQYSASLVDEGEILPPPSGLDQVRRSSSTPSTSAFRQRSAGSAFGAHLRTMPRLSDPEDRIGSAFSLPMQRSSYASVSDSGVRYSAFDPIAFPGMDDMSEKTSIEVTDLGPPSESEDEPKCEIFSATPAKWGAARRAKTFLSDVRVLKFRKRRSGRENPARPPSSSSSSKSDESKQKDTGDNDTISTKSSANTKEYRSDRTDRKPAAKRDGRPPKSAFPSTILESTKKSGNKEPREYHQLESEFDEDYEHYQGIETSIGHSPHTVPSPSYHRFVDDHVASETTETTNVVGGANTSAVRIDVSTVTSPPHTPGNDGYSICRPHLEGSNATTLSQGSEPQSPGTNNTSGHTTQATSTSATISSGRITLLSTVSETDREVMETNKAGKIMRLHQQNPTRTDGESSVHSASTTSTNTYGYLALTGSPAPLRDGASLPTDRFFTQSRIPVAHSSSSNSGGSSSSGSGGARCVNTSGSSIAPADASQASSSVPSKKSSCSPHTDSSVSAANTASSHSIGEEPPKFVSYLDRQGSESTKLSRDGVMSTMSSQYTPERVGNENEDRESPAHIVGYLDVVFEEAQSQSTNLIRPVQQRDPKFASRPPLSPVKGLRAPDTPPPSSGRPDSYSPAYQQLSPPNIVDHRVNPGHSNLSKPYVFRSAPPRASSDSHLLASPEMSTRSTTFAISPDITSEAESYIYSTVDLEGPMESYDSHRNRTYIEASIEVEKSDETTTHVPVVSPDKGST